MDIAVRDKPSSGKYFPGPDLHVGVCGSLAARSPQSHGPGQARFAYGSARAGLAFDLGALARGERGCAAVWGVHIMTMKYVGDQYDMANVCCGTSDTYQLTEIWLKQFQVDFEKFRIFSWERKKKV